MFKGLILALLFFGCSPKKPENPVQDVGTIFPPFTVIAGSCYRYPNKDNEDVHVKVIRTYMKGGFYGEFIHHQLYFNYIHDFNESPRHLKEIECAMYDDLRSISKPRDNG